MIEREVDGVAVIVIVVGSVEGLQEEGGGVALGKGDEIGRASCRERV